MKKLVVLLLALLLSLTGCNENFRRDEKIDATAPDSYISQPSGDSKKTSGSFETKSSIDFDSLFEDNTSPQTSTVMDAPDSCAQSEQTGLEYNKQITVYITKTGSKYHVAGCQYLSKSKVSISLSTAIKSYSPCSQCRPPAG